MNKIKVLAVACLASIAFAKYGDGGNLWDFPNMLQKGSYKTGAGNDPFWGQVHTPGAIYCWDNVTPSATNGWGKPCFDGTGGWWFGYADNGGIVKDAISNNKVFVTKEESATRCDTELPPDEAVGDVITNKYIEVAAGTSTGQRTEWIPHAVNHTNTAGQYLIKGYGLGNATDGFNVNFANPAGTDEDPTVSAIGFNWRALQRCEKEDYQNIYSEDISSKEGLCVVYKADKGDANFGVDVELGWNENLNGYNTWIVRLPATTGFKTLNMKWNHFRLSYESEDVPPPIETALTQAEALKFAFKNKTNAAVTINFQLKEVGWYGSCSGTAEEPGGTPIIGGNMASAYKFSLNGRMLSANFAGPVQVVNLQGKVVAQKALAKDERLNLANLPVGIYMVRSESRGIVQKIMVK